MISADKKGEKTNIFLRDGATTIHFFSTTLKCYCISKVLTCQKIILISIYFLGKVGFTNKYTSSVNYLAPYNKQSADE